MSLERITISTLRQRARGEFTLESTFEGRIVQLLELSPAQHEIYICRRNDKNTQLISKKIENRQCRLTPHFIPGTPIPDDIKDASELSDHYGNEAVILYRIAESNLVIIERYLPLFGNINQEEISRALGGNVALNQNLFFELNAPVYFAKLLHQRKGMQERRALTDLLIQADKLGIKYHIWHPYRIEKVARQ